MRPKKWFAMRLRSKQRAQIMTNSRLVSRAMRLSTLRAAGPNNASIIPGDSDRASLSHFHLVSFCAWKMSDWTSDANESLTLSLGKHIHFHKLHSNRLMRWRFGQQWDRKRTKISLERASHTKHSTLPSHIRYECAVTTPSYSIDVRIQLVALDLWRRRENLWLSGPFHWCEGT